MSTFQEFLHQQIQREGFSTEDVLVSFLPLLKQVMFAHEYGEVAPLEGIEQLQVEGVRVSYPESSQCPQRRNMAAVRKLLQSNYTAIEVIGESRLVIDVNAGVQDNRDLRISTTGDTITRPVFVTGYRSWEHLVGHHIRRQTCFLWD